MQNINNMQTPLNPYIHFVDDKNQMGASLKAGEEVVHIHDILFCNLLSA